MEGDQKSSHAIYRCEYHFVWIPKYRYQVLVDEIKTRLKEILMELCAWLDITIIEGVISSDHIHMYISVPPKYSPSQVMKVLKGKSAYRKYRLYLCPAQVEADWIWFHKQYR